MLTKTIKAVMKNNTEYTLVFNTREVTSSLAISIAMSGQVVHEMSIANNTRYKLDITAPASISNEYMQFIGLTHSKQIYDVMLVERGVDIPYFNGMKSVGELEDNTIRITSGNGSNLSNVKQIPLSEPLRSLPNGVKDRFVKLSGKWYIERNCGEVVLDGTFTPYRTRTTTLDTYRWTVYCSNSVANLTSDTILAATCDKYPVNTARTTYLEVEGVSQNNSTNSIHLYLDRYKRGQDEDTLNLIEELKRISPTVVYQLATPTYEPIELSSEFETYLDSTHISNDSFIPCNMKVKNTGYESIVKPNTVYTVALDTNKAGNIGVNLGGSKVTTNNNVATITTPNSLSDDSLRLHGKGVKGSKVRLLEGDKTNWIPSHFEGMMSSFEDVENVVELKSVNENLFEITNGIVSSGMSSVFVGNGIRIFSNGSPYEHGYNAITYKLKLKPNAQYAFSYSKTINKGEGSASCGRCYIFKNGVHSWTNIDGNKIVIKTDYNGDLEFKLLGNWSNVKNEYDVEFTNINLTEIDTTYIEHKSNKIQLQLQEPLRGIGDVKDRFVFKDGKVMVERKCDYRKLDGSESGQGNSWRTWVTPTAPYIGFAFELLVGAKLGRSPIIADTLFNINANATTDKNIYMVDRNLYLSLNRKYLYPNLNLDGFKAWLQNNPTTVVYQLETPTYEEIPTELADLILECYEDGTLFIDTIIPPTVSVKYAGETPMVANLKQSRQATSHNLDDVNSNITPYLCDIDYRVVRLQIAIGQDIPNYKSIGNAFEILKKDIQTQRLSKDEYVNRIETYFQANKLTKEEYEVLGGLLND